MSLKTKKNDRRARCRGGMAVIGGVQRRSNQGCGNKVGR